MKPPLWQDAAEKTFKSLFEGAGSSRWIARRCCEVIAYLQNGSVVNRLSVEQGLSAYRTFRETSNQPFEKHGITLDTSPPYQAFIVKTEVQEAFEHGKLEWADTSGETSLMSKRFDTYEEAYYHASNRTKELGVAHGIERAKEYRIDGFNVHMLPKPENRYGWELRCEAVEIGSPVLYKQESQRLERQRAQMRYSEESTTRENPLRVGTKRIKVNGVEYPFIAVSDHWRPALLHENRLVWIHYYRAIEGLRRGIFKVYYATVKVPYNRLPWTIDNACFGSEENGREFRTLKEAIDVAMILAEDRGRMIEIASKSSVAEAGRKGGLVKSEKKAKQVKENGAKGGRPKSAVLSPDLKLFE